AACRPDYCSRQWARGRYRNARRTAGCECHLSRNCRLSGKGGIRMSPKQSSPSRKRTLKRLLGKLAPRKKRILIVFFATILSTVIAIFAPKVMGDTITIVFEVANRELTGSGAGIDFTKVALMLLLLAGLYAFRSLFTLMQQYLMASVAQNTVYDLRTAIFNKLERLPLKYYDHHAHGDTMRRFVNDLRTIGNTLHQ